MKKSLYDSCENVKPAKPKFRVYELDFGDTNVVTENYNDITDWISTEMQDLKEGERLNYKITFRMMTRRQINSLPEWS